MFKKLLAWKKKKTDKTLPDEAVLENPSNIVEELPEENPPEQAEAWKVSAQESSVIEPFYKMATSGPSIPGAETTLTQAEPFESSQLEAETGAAEGKKPNFFLRLKERLKKTRQSFTKKLDRIFLGKRQITPELLEELEEALVTADMGINTVDRLLSTIREEVSRSELNDSEALKSRLKARMLEMLMSANKTQLAWQPAPFVALVVGVNGVGKTTSIAKLTHYLKDQGKTVILGAADTFRAAAIDQLGIWAERLGVDMVKHQSGSDPSAVAFDTVEAGVKRGMDVIIIDTAGRLHTKTNLMEELRKLRRTVGKKLTTAPHEVLLVLDATTGQNAVSQARLFKDAAGVTGIILTKLDGSAKGGIVVAIAHELGLPIRFIGIGESMDDLRPFDPAAFVDAIFEED